MRHDADGLEEKETAASEQARGKARFENVGGKISGQ